MQELGWCQDINAKSNANGQQVFEIVSNDCVYSAVDRSIQDHLIVVVLKLWSPLKVYVDRDDDSTQGRKERIDLFPGPTMNSTVLIALQDLLVLKEDSS